MRTEDVRALPESARKRFYERFLMQLTIVGRIIWADEQTTSQQKVEAFKWLNEINHRVLGRLLEPSPQSLEGLPTTIEFNCRQSQLLTPGVEGAWDRALRFAIDESKKT